MRYLFIALFLFCLSLPALAYDKEVLLLQSYNKGLKWSDGISEGVLSVFKHHPEYEVTTEYMDSKKIDSKAYFESMLDLYRKKFANRHYEVILAADNFAFDFALQYADELFPNSPIVFCGVENFNPAEIEAHDARHKTTGVVEYKEVEKSLALIGELVPNLKKLYIISDRAYSSMRIKDQILAAKEKFSDRFEIVYDNDILLETLTQKLENLPTRSAVLFTSLYRDTNEVYVPYAKLKTFFKSSPLPIFALTSIHLGEGVVGGIMVDPFVQGSEAAKKAIQIVKSGMSPEKIPITTPKAQPMFDMKMLTKHALYTEKLPEDAIVINKPLGFLERNREFVNSVFTLSPLLVFFTLALLFGLYKKTVLEEQLRAQSELDSVLLNTIQSAIFWRSHDGNLLGCNKALCLLLNKSKTEIIGKHMNDVMPQFCHYLQEDDETHFQTDLEIPFLDIDGKKRHLMVRRKRFERGVVTIVTDITQRMEIEREYKRHEQFVLQRSKQAEVGEMLASIAHQWKTPLIEISAIAQSLVYARRKREISPEEAKEFSHDIMQQVTYMTQTIDDFRAFIKPSTEAVMFDVKQAVSEILSILSHTLKYNYIDVTFTCKESSSLETYGYPNEFKQTLLNMLNNAKDAILKQRKHHKNASNICLTLTQTSHQIMLSVEDDGGGIDPDSLPHVFDPFYSTKEHGDGFGLYMAKLIIEDKMHGRILATNTDKGAKMSIYLEKKSSKG